MSKILEPFNVDDEEKAKDAYRIFQALIKGVCHTVVLFFTCIKSFTFLAILPYVTLKMIWCFDNNDLV